MAHVASFSYGALCGCGRFSRKLLFPAVLLTCSWLLFRTPFVAWPALFYQDLLGPWGSPTEPDPRTPYAGSWHISDFRNTHIPLVLKNPGSQHRCNCRVLTPKPQGRLSLTSGFLRTASPWPQASLAPPIAGTGTGLPFLPLLEKFLEAPQETPWNSPS